MNWRVKLNGVDITAYVSGVQTRFESENLCGECEVALASRAPIAGLVVPRVPQSLSIAVEECVDGAWLSRGEYFLEQRDFPQDLDAKTASIWGRSGSARLTAPWAQKISKQWPGGNTVAGIIAEVASMAGVTVNVTNDFDVCQYCYAVSDQTPAEIIRDLATKSGQILWPQIDGTLTVAPRLYTYGTPDVTLDAAEIVVESVDRQVPDFGNRILVSGDASVAGLSVQVVPMYPEDKCVSANGRDVVRLIAVVLGADGDFVAPGTTVNWSAGAGFLADASSNTGYAEIIGEEHRADDYYHVTLDLPAAAVIGVYAYDDIRRKRNLYQTRRGSVSGRTITFLSPLDYFDQALLIDYEVLGAINEWTAGRVPGDVTILASVAGAQGLCTVHQSNPTACASTLTLESVPSQVCLGDRATITAKATMFGGAGSGVIRFGMTGCGSLSSSQKVLSTSAITERVRTTNWGGVTQIRVSAMPASGAINVYLESEPGTNLYASHKGQTINLNTVLLSGTEVVVSYPGGGTAAITWTPTGAAGDTITSEIVQSFDDGGVSKITLSLPPVTVLKAVANPASYWGTNIAGAVSGNTVTLTEVLTPGTDVYCRYWTPQPLLPDCEATILARIDDGSQDGGTASIKVTARDCRTQSTDPAVPPDDTSPDDPPAWPDLEDDEEEEEEQTGVGCDAVSIQGRTPAITADNWDAVAGVASGEDCPGLCTCDEICAALRSNGTLATAGEFYSTCMAKCAEARAAKCTPCTLTGPSILNPGQEGTWTDGKGNSAEVSGGNALTFVSRDFEDGYTLRMPTGGAGPFTIRVCYGEDEASCCEAQVDFPPCTLSGQDQLNPGVESLYLPSAGMEGATCTCGGDMEFVRLGGYGVGFVCRMKQGGCEGTVTVAYGGVVCGQPLTVTNPKKDYVGNVAGDSVLEPGETAIYYHDLGPGAKYTGALPGTPFENELGNGVIGTMPGNASQGQQFKVSFAGACGSKAEMMVEATPCLVNPSLVDYADSSTWPQIGQWLPCSGGVFPETGGYFQVYAIANGGGLVSRSYMESTYPSGLGGYMPSCGSDVAYVILLSMTPYDQYDNCVCSTKIFSLRNAQRTNPC